MKQKLLVLVLFLLTFTRANAAERIAGASATMAASMQKQTSTEASYNLSIKDYAVKKRAIKRVLAEYNSPLQDASDSFVKTCITYNIDCYLLPSIAGLESTFGKAILPGSYNPFGWGGGYMIFRNWGDSIETVAYGLRSNYVKEGPITPDMIGRKYSESGTWAVRVSGFMARFRAVEENELQSKDFALE